jgi:2-methylcitrate dehydratase PrpD
MHVLDFEPMWSPANHAVLTTVPAVLAVAESRRALADGQVTIDTFSDRQVQDPVIQDFVGRVRLTMDATMARQLHMPVSTIGVILSRLGLGQGSPRSNRRRW